MAGGGTTDGLLPTMACNTAFRVRRPYLPSMLNFITWLKLVARRSPSVKETELSMRLVKIDANRCKQCLKLAHPFGNRWRSNHPLYLDLNLPSERETEVEERQVCSTLDKTRQIFFNPTPSERGKVNYRQEKREKIQSIHLLYNRTKCLHPDFLHHQLFNLRCCFNRHFLVRCCIHHFKC